VIGATIDSPYEAGSPEDFVYVSAIYGNSAAHQRQINAAEARILARQAAVAAKCQNEACPIGCPESHADDYCGGLR
jgi:hypothetical protein